MEEESCISPRTGKLYLVIKMMTISKRLLFFAESARQYLYGDDDVVKSLEKVEEEEGYGDNRNDDEGDEGEEDSTDPSLIGKITTF